MSGCRQYQLFETNQSLGHKAASKYALGMPEMHWYILHRSH